MAAPHHCSHMQSTRFASPAASHSSQRHKTHFSHGRFLLSLELQSELVSHSLHSKSSTLSSPCTSGSTAWCPHHPSSQWDQPGFRPQGNRATSMGARSCEMNKIKTMPFAYCFQFDRFPLSCEGFFFFFNKPFQRACVLFKGSKHSTLYFCFYSRDQLAKYSICSI